MHPRKTLLWLVTAVVAPAVSSGVTHAQVRSSVTLGPHAVEVDGATDTGQPASVDMQTTRDGYTFGRVTVLVPGGISAAYGLHSPGGATVLRSVQMAVGVETDVFSSGTLIRNPAAAKPITLGGGFCLGSRPTATVWARDENDDGGRTFVRMRAEVDPDKMSAHE